MPRFVNRSKFLSILLTVSAFGTGRSQAAIDKKSAAISADIGIASAAGVSAVAFLIKICFLIMKRMQLIL